MEQADYLFIILKNIIAFWRKEWWNTLLTHQNQKTERGNRVCFQGRSAWDRGTDRSQAEWSPSGFIGWHSPWWFHMSHQSQLDQNNELVLVLVLFILSKYELRWGKAYNRDTYLMYLKSAVTVICGKVPCWKTNFAWKPEHGHWLYSNNISKCTLQIQPPSGIKVISRWRGMHIGISGWHCLFLVSGCSNMNFISDFSFLMEKKSPFNVNYVCNASVCKFFWKDIHGPTPFCLGVECAEPTFLKNRCG